MLGKGTLLCPIEKVVFTLLITSMTSIYLHVFECMFCLYSKPTQAYSGSWEYIQIFLFLQFLKLLIPPFSSWSIGQRHQKMHERLKVQQSPKGLYFTSLILR